jgi:hypothetical protein
VNHLLDDPTDEPFCSTQIPHLLFVEDLARGRLPYLEPCVPIAPGVPCDEYPVLTMYAMWTGGVGGREPLPFFLTSAALLSACAIATAWLLARRVGLRALYFTAAPTLLFYGLMNWDLVAVALSVWGITAFLDGRDTRAGVATGLATAAKLFPVLILGVLAADRLRIGRREGARRLVVGAAVAWLAVNLPFAIAAPREWSLFYRFNSSRPPDVDTAWYAACRWATGDPSCLPTGLVNVVSLALFAVGGVLVWRAASRREPTLEPWTLGFPLLALLFVTNKVSSPQYDLFLLPWFALVLPDVRVFAVFTVAGMAVFATRYADIAADPGVAFLAAALARDAALLLCVVAYARRWTAPRTTGHLRPERAAA